MKDILSIDDEVKKLVANKRQAAEFLSNLRHSVDPPAPQTDDRPCLSWGSRRPRSLRNPARRLDVATPVDALLPHPAEEPPAPAPEQIDPVVALEMQSEPFLLPEMIEEFDSAMNLESEPLSLPEMIHAESNSHSRTGGNPFSLDLNRMPPLEDAPAPGKATNPEHPPQ